MAAEGWLAKFEDLPHNGIWMKKVLIIILILLLLTAIPVTVYFIQREQDIRSKAAPATTLSLRPATVTKNVGDTQSFDVVIDTGENDAFYAAIEISFDPTKVDCDSITNGPIFPNVESPGTTDPAGKLAIGAGVANTAEPFNGTGIAAIIRCKMLAATTGSTTIQFTSETAVGGTDQGTAKNILIGTTPAKVTIVGAGVSPTPTSGTVVSPTPTGSAAGSPTPTGMVGSPTPTGASGSPTLTPEPTDTGSPDATPSSAPTPTPTTVPGNNNGSVTIISPTETDGAVSARPLIRGTAPPNSTVTITIYSEPMTAVVTADANGAWSYTPTTDLEAGPHDIVVMATAADGTTYNTTGSFVVTGGTGDQDQTAIPQSGDMTPTVILIVLGLMLLGSGIVLNVARKNNEFTE